MIRLANHQIIAWDFDDTLIGHPYSRKMVEFIRENPYGQEHHIVSFRSHGMELNFERDLLAEHGELADISLFAKLHNLPDKLYEGSALGQGLILSREEDPTVEWKGMICNQIGATVLIDDMTDQVARGCDKYGVLHIHPDELEL